MGLSLLLASAFAGTLSRSIVHPMDTLRSRLMVSTSRTASLRSALSDIISEDGIQGLYRGFWISVTMQAPAVATYLSTYDYSKQYISRETNTPDTSPVIHLASGFVAEAVSAVFWVPMEVIKQRAQVRTGALAAAQTTVIARDLIAHEGPQALFRGYGLTLGVFGPYAMTYFMVYEKFKSLGGDSSTPAIALSAAGAGAIAGACTSPLDVIKTRIQTQGDVSHGGLRYSGTWDAIRCIAREEGIQGFLRGTSARVLWIMPGTAITMSCFEFLKSFFRLGPERQR
ncbi:Mitochondrial substrate carrier family protein E [Gracilariopsis chorda]|uniref:Mitochondrial substrate carrier family protein E n=1 Tax=Gracilariopsis chorda TaxID=448386 RepID=A0A2V3ILV5_9FLOR|nr:Mitochondrial substrate carrier family protein E [Gracilariopsis chorda]|eukprot:PXF42100.1 Mitochondrial substrate carrier family protein E [Gracilariopsis chorda]